VDDPIISRIHLDGLQMGRRFSVFKMNSDTGERLGLLATPAVGDGGWVQQAIIVRMGDAFMAMADA
jgi:hypothetical protein